ncbi:hypothetical protein L6164_007424 [Bauhinia variegata]|uniref:Uncharacterized protein n=1 Tax=Bauhinia variegata TaxID=167791 RepID=A0ACB9PJ07_BAUVA|nr:hypothetical protein L6164_007424 [Bauhinia variegata]
MTLLCASSFSLSSLLLVSFLVVLVSHFSESEAQPSTAIAEGLSWIFHRSSCPNLESIVRNHLKKVFKKDIGQAAALLRIFFHDCFVQGCDASVLLDGSFANPSEKEAPPNFTLRPDAMKTLEDLRALVHKTCGRVVSCADITTLAGRDAVFLSEGPDFAVPLGRRDGLTFATRATTLANLPGPGSTADALLRSLGALNFDAADVVALSGAHTIGRCHCNSFTSRLYPTQDPTMETTFAINLKLTCPTGTTVNTTVLDIRTPNKFDNRYYVDLVSRQGLFTSDQDLFFNERTRGIVTSFSKDQKLFFDKFVNAVTKMGQMSVLTGKQGEIRANCSVRNSDNRFFLPSSVVEEAVEEWAQI